MMPQSGHLIETSLIKTFAYTLKMQISVSRISIYGFPLHLSVYCSDNIILHYCVFLRHSKKSVRFQRYDVSLPNNFQFHHRRFVLSEISEGNVNRFRIDVCGRSVCGYFTEMVRGGQFGELRRRGSLIDDEEQLVCGFVFTAARG